MGKKKNLDDILPMEKTLNLFSEECKKLSSNLSVYHQDVQSEQHVEEEVDSLNSLPSEAETQIHLADSSFSCTSCGVSFGGTSEQRDHFKMDWHRYNVKQKSCSKAIVSEDAFEAMLGHLDECSSISGSDTDSDENIDTEEAEEDEVESKDTGDMFSSHAYKTFLIDSSTHSIMSVFKNSISNASSDQEIIENFKKSVTSKVWVYAMLSAGHFAAAVFHHNEVKAHKTYHRYIVRAKQGGAQSAHDAKNSQAKSAGASIRRHNEQALTNEIQELMVSWKEHLKVADKIFIKCAPNNNHIFYNERTGFRKDDCRFTKISVMTRRPTLKEVKRLHQLYTSVFIHCSITKVEEMLKDMTFMPSKNQKSTTSSKKSLLSTATHKDRSRSPSPAQQIVDPRVLDCLEVWNKANEQCQKGNLELLQKILGSSDATFYVTEHECVTDESDLGGREYLIKKRMFFEDGYLNQCHGENAETLLHCAAKGPESSAVSFLMSIGSDPAVKDKRGRLPYNIASCKENRNEFRRFMGKYSDKYDYIIAQVPSPLTEEAEQSKKEKEAEKRRQQNKARKQRQKQKKAEEYKEKETEREKKKEEEQIASEKAKFEALSAREKCAMMAERRLATHLSASSKCSNCKTSLENIVPFERYEYKYCSTDCVHEHKAIIGK